MSIWSATNIPVSFLAQNGAFVLVDITGARIDWPAIATREEATKELALFRRELRAADRAAESEAFGLSRMTAIEEPR